MTLAMRRKLAREPYEEKIRKVGMLLALVKATPKLGKRRSGVRGATRPTI